MNLQVCQSCLWRPICTVKDICCTRCSGTQGWRSARIYTVNGVCLFVSWLFARIVLFVWFFNHMWTHRADVADLRTDVKCLVLTVPPLLFVLNVFWFGKIVRGLLKLLRGQLAKVCCLLYCTTHDFASIACCMPIPCLIGVSVSNALRHCMLFMILHSVVITHKNVYLCMHHDSNWAACSMKI